MSDSESDSNEFIDHNFEDGSDDMSDGDQNGGSQDDFDEEMLNGHSDDSDQEMGLDSDEDGYNEIEDIDPKLYKLTAADKAALARGKVGPPRREKKHIEQSSADDSSDEDTPQVEDDGVERAYSRPSLNHIRNKIQNTQEAARQTKVIAKKEKKERRKKRERENEELGPEAPPKQKPKAIETLREADETFVLPADDEVREDEAQDEFAAHFEGKVKPKILITTNLKATKESYKFIIELVRVIPNAFYHARKSYSLKTIVGYAKNREFTHLIVINEDNKKPNGLLLTHLPNGPTALFKLSSVILSKGIQNHASMSKHLPEMILNNFNTRLGHTIGRLFGSLFPLVPQFEGRRVITIHNQRDFIFFRQHRYVFDSSTEARLQEMGPQFTLKLRSLQHGTFDTKFGEYEFVHKSENRPYARRKFVL